jgi:hypothetical protein
LFRTFDDQSRESSLTFDFRVEACSQLMLVRSSFTLPVVKLDDPRKFPFNAASSNDKNCFSADPESFDDVQLTRAITINTANPDDRYDRPFQRHLDKLNAVMTWKGPKFRSTLGPQERQNSREWKEDRHAIEVVSEGFTRAACKFFKTTYAGSLIFLCDTSFSRPRTNSHRLAVRVKAGWQDNEAGYLLLEAFLIQADWFYRHARQHADQMLAKRQLGLVLDLDKTLILTNPPKELGAQIEQSGNRDERLKQLRDGRWVALRAGVKEMLHTLHSQHDGTDDPPFELHIFCNGTSTYALEALNLFHLLKYFGRRRVTSGYWTTHESLAFGLGGYKDFRSIFDFHRYPKYQEMVLAIDDMTLTWDNPVALWRRTEKPCILQIRGYAENSMRMSQSNDTVDKFHEVLLNVHKLFFQNEDLRGNTSAGITMNIDLYDDRTTGYMKRCCATAEKQMRLSTAPERPRLEGTSKLAADMQRAQAQNETAGVARIIEQLEKHLNLTEVFEVVTKLGLTTRLMRDDGKTVWRGSDGFRVLENVAHDDEVRRIWVERVKAVYQTDPAQFKLQVYFNNEQKPSAKPITVSMDMPMHDFVHGAMLEWEKEIHRELHGFFSGDEIACNPMHDLQDNPVRSDCSMYDR